MRWLRGTALGVVTCLAIGCGASLPTSAEAAAAETADTVCGMLRRWNNEIAESVNATSKTITDADDSTTANGVLLEGIDELIALAEDQRAELDDLDLPNVAERDRLLDDLRVGADEAIDELESERSEVEDLPPITIDDQRGVLGGLFVALEGAQSAVEPPIGTYADAELRRAFAADDGCEHVIQPF
jgi:hypothetical protein